MAHVVAYTWKPNRSFGVPAQLVGERLAQIEARNGALHPQDFVDDARPEDAPTHALFQWDDALAAEAHRVHQARMIIGSVVVQQVDNRAVNGSVNAFVNIRSEAGQSYHSVATAMTDDEKRALILKQAIDDLRRWRQRYADLQAFASLFSVIDQFELAAPEAA